MKTDSKKINGNSSIEINGKMPTRHKKLSLHGYLKNNLKAFDP